MSTTAPSGSVTWWTASTASSACSARAAWASSSRPRTCSSTQRVAIKFLLPDAARETEQAVARFAREARAAVKIKSEHVARVIDVGELDDRRAVHGDGVPRGQRPRRARRARAARCPIDEAVDYVLAGLRGASPRRTRSGIVHRDLKPANLFLAARPDGTQVDQGARLRHLEGAPTGRPRPRSSTLTDDRGHHRLAALHVARADALGARRRRAQPTSGRSASSCTSCSAAKSPFDARHDARGSARRSCKDAPLSLAALRPGSPAGLETRDARCLEKHAGRRYRNVAELALALRPFGPHGIIDISIERVVGIVQIGMLTVDPPEDRRSKAPTSPTTNVSRAPTTPAITHAGTPAGRPPAPSNRATTCPPSGRAPTAAAITQPAAPEPARGRASRPPAAPEPARGRASRPPVAPPDEAHYLARIGPKKQIPRVAMTADHIRTLTLDHRCGFLLSLVDGTSSIEDILDVRRACRTSRRCG